MGKDAEKFVKLGVTAKDPLEAFKQLADVFSAIKDPQLRAALGAEALGKSWASAAPLLSEGGNKIGEMVARGTNLSGVTKEMALQADEFNDTLAEFGMMAEAAKMRLAGDLLPALTEVCVGRPRRRWHIPIYRSLLKCSSQDQDPSYRDRAA